MPARVSRRLVIDASVARSAGGEHASYPRSKNCRDFLSAVLTICHHIVLTPEISKEEREHWSSFSRKWLDRMYGRKKVHYVGNPVNADLRGRIEHALRNATEKERAAVRKDFLLIEAALLADRTVVSLDDIARNLFARTAQTVGELRGFAWVNPDRAEEEPILWLENGARPEKRHLLGFRTEGSS